MLRVFNQMLIGQFPSDLEIEGRQTILILLAQIQNISDGIVVGQPDMDFGSAEKLTNWLAGYIGYPNISFAAIGSSLVGGLYGISRIKASIQGQKCC